jgi:hypothetical protein
LRGEAKVIVFSRHIVQGKAVDKLPRDIVWGVAGSLFL